MLTGSKIIIFLVIWFGLKAIIKVLERSGDFIVAFIILGIMIKMIAFSPYVNINGQTLFTVAVNTIATHFAI